MRRCRPDAQEGAQLLTEGKARILLQGNDVFFNPAQASAWPSPTPLQVVIRAGTEQPGQQVVNRDISIAVLNHFAAVRQEELAAGKAKRPNKKGVPVKAAEGQAPELDGMRLLEGLAASGLRSIRYASEVCSASVAAAASSLWH